MIALHHPPFLTGVKQFDDINLRNHEEFRALIARHKQVTRIISGHHHRMIVGNVAQAIGFVAPSIAYQFMLTHDAGIEMGFNLEPSAFLLHSWTPEQGLRRRARSSSRSPARSRSCWARIIRGEERGRFLKKAAQKFWLCWAMGCVGASAHGPA